MWTYSSVPARNALAPTSARAPPVIKRRAKAAGVPLSAPVNGKVSGLTSATVVLTMDVGDTSSGIVDVVLTMDVGDTSSGMVVVVVASVVVVVASVVVVVASVVVVVASVVVVVASVVVVGSDELVVVSSRS
jgi:uncharacterized membrane protein HdeD (DUF308 family)